MTRHASLGQNALTFKSRCHGSSYSFSVGVVENCACRSLETVAVYRHHKGNFTPTDELTRASISSDLDKFSFDRVALRHPHAHAIAVTRVGSPASGLACCMVPSE